MAAGFIAPLRCFAAQGVAMLTIWNAIAHAWRPRRIRFDRIVDGAVNGLPSMRVNRPSFAVLAVLISDACNLTMGVEMPKRLRHASLEWRLGSAGVAVRKDYLSRYRTGLVAYVDLFASRILLLSRHIACQG